MGPRWPRRIPTTRRLLGISFRVVPAGSIALLLSSCSTTSNGEPSIYVSLSELIVRMVPLFWAATAVVVFALIILAARRPSLEKRRQHDRKLLSTEGSDVLSVGRLLDMLFGPDIDNQASAATALLKVLPLLDNRHAGLLHERQRHLLHRSLSHPDTYLVCAVLSALEHIGDARARPHLQRLKRTNRDPRVEAGVAKCLSSIKERSDRQRSGEMLLRPVSGAEGNTGNLLTPVMSASTEDPKLLLRASNPAEGDA
jgi:hypothetical protein